MVSVLIHRPTNGGFFMTDSLTPSEAINRAVPRATHAINIATLTLSASFALLAIVPLTTFRQFAFAMAVGVLIDSFLVRIYLVPSLITLVGKTSFWPQKM